MALLLKREDEVRALLTSGALVTDQAQDATGKTWTIVDFATQGEELQIFAPFSEKEEKIITILNILLENGLDRDTLLDGLKTSSPRLYQGLLSEPEQILISVLRFQSVLEKVITGAKALPPTGHLLWKQRTVERTFSADFLSESLQSLFSKLGGSATPVYREIKQTFQAIALTLPSRISPVAMRDEKCKQFASILQSIEEASFQLTDFQSDFFQGAGPPTVEWVPTDDVVPDSSDG